jgi:hypothetical protein
MRVREISIKWFEVRGLWLGSLISRVQAVKANRGGFPGFEANSCSEA